MYCTALKENLTAELTENLTTVFEENLSSVLTNNHTVLEYKLKSANSSNRESDNGTINRLSTGTYTRTFVENLTIE